MEPIATINKLKESDVYQEWRKGHKESYLVHAFTMAEGKQDKQKREWQVGFYIKEHDKIATFFVGNEIKISPESEIFKEDKTIVRELDINNVRVDADKAVDEALEYQKSVYPNEKPTRTIVILQNLDKVVYNITFITVVFNTLNIRVSAEDGKIVSHKLNSLMDMADVRKGLKSKDKDKEYIG